MTREPTALIRFVAVALRVAIALVVLMTGFKTALLDTGWGNVLEFLAGVAVGAAVMGGAAVVAKIAASLAAAVELGQLFLFAAVCLTLAFLSQTSPAEIWQTLLDTESWSWPLGIPDSLSVPAVSAVIFSIACTFAWFAVLRDRENTPPARLIAALATLSLVLVAAALYVLVSLATDGRDPFPTDYALARSDTTRTAMSDPSEAGSFAIERLSYGAGANERRPEFGRRRVLESRTVDASALLPEWKGLKQRMRERYWGFGLNDAPLNGLVWAPEGEGPFPLVLIVHGNHGMEEYSDPGYAYLGELLASRGMIAVSVDENYINGSWSGDFRGKEMAIRGWLLLEHLALWRDWNALSGHRFDGRVDMENVALIGHSRGGEALPIAYTMNALERHPDDATIEFDYGFAIRSLVAIAQVDQRYHRRLELRDVNFLALQGSYDSDEPAFHGLRQFNRIALGDSAYRFKAGVYAHGANHGQFNTIWGREDMSPPGAWRLNLAPLISAEDQQQIAKVYIAAFLEATLKGRDEYLPLFRDPRVGADWLPAVPLVHQFNDSTFLPIADFEEDLDVLTATVDGSTVRARGFTTWREEELRHRDERLQGSSAVVLGWTAEPSARYEIELPASFWETLDVQNAWLTLHVSGSTEKPADDGDEDDAENGETDDPVAPAFTLHVEDFDGNAGHVHSSDVAQLAPPLRVRYLKHEALNDERYKDNWEPVLQYLEVPLARFAPTAQEGEVQGFRYIALEFDDAAPGVAIVDNIGVRRGSLAR